MKVLRAAIATPALAPLAHWRLAVLLWLARLLPILLVFGIPAYDGIAARSAHHPDAGLLLEAGGDAGGFTYAWTSDFFRDALTDAGDTIFWLVVFSWLLVSILAGGIVTRLVHGRSLRGGLFMAECGRYAGRLLRLAFIAAFVLYWADFACNSFLARRHDELARLQHVQDYGLESQWARGLLFLALIYVVGLVHSYARIDIVAHERRSALLSFLRGFGMLLRRLPSLLVLEFGVLLVTGAAALLAWLVLKGANPLHADAGWLTVGLFLALAALTSYLRSGVEVGAVAARCALLVPPPADESIVSQIEAALTPDGGGVLDAGPA